MYDVFISHSSIDKLNFVEPLYSALINAGLQVWYDKYNIISGDNIRETIMNGVQSSVIFLAVISKNYFECSWANIELGILQTSFPENCIPVIFNDAKDLTRDKYFFLLNKSYIDGNSPINEIAIKIVNMVNIRKKERGIWHIEKTNIKALIKEMFAYNDFKLNQLALYLSRFNDALKGSLIILFNNVSQILKFILSDVAVIENIYVDPSTSVINRFIEIEFLNCNIKEHLKYLNLRYTEIVINGTYISESLNQDDLYLISFSIYSVVEWYVFTYFKKPVFNQKKLKAVMPEEFTKEDIKSSFEIEHLVLPKNLIASLSTDIEWFEYNPLTTIGVRDTETNKLVGFFNTLPITDRLFKKIKSGNFDDTQISINDIRQYDIPGFYKLYLCSFCIHPAYNTTAAFKIIYTSFIDFLLNLAIDREIYISDIIADGVTAKGSSLCESIGMTKIAKSCHGSDVYIASLIPPSISKLKITNLIGRKLLAYYQKTYNEYKDIF